MIDFTNIKDAAGWASAAQGLLNVARDAAKGRNVNAMKQASSDLLTFLQNRTSDCPGAVVEAVSDGQGELALAIDSASIDAIDAATVQLAAFVIDVQRVSVELNQKAKLIKLEPVIDTLNSITTLVNEAKRLQNKLKGQNAATIDIAGLETGVSNIIAQLNTIAGDLKQVTGQT